MRPFPINYTDFYKVGHVIQYQKGIDQIWCNWTPRNSLIPGIESIVWVGLQRFMVRYLTGGVFKEHFFDRPFREIEAEYKRKIQERLGVTDPRTDHIRKLHDYGYFPLSIYALDEGEHVPIGMPPAVITNTEPDMFWLPNWLETLFSLNMWKTSTSATIAREYRKQFVKYARLSGETDLGFVDWQGHDFSMRGMSGIEDALMSGIGHLVFFSGTDTQPAIDEIEDIYFADPGSGGSVNATEHSVMMAGSQGGELETVRRLLTEVNPTGVFSIVSDTWDLWKMLTEYIPALKDIILNRDGKYVCRPDSGEPPDILCGDDAYIGERAHNYVTERHPAEDGVFRLLAQALGTTTREGILPLIDHAGAIYGDSITLERNETILNRLVHELGMSSYNYVAGIGSFTYEYKTRDTFGHAMKATACRMGDKVIPMFKDPVTGDGKKKSCYGIPAVYRRSGGLIMEDESRPEDLDNCAYRRVFHNGDIEKVYFWKDIRALARYGE